MSRVKCIRCEDDLGLNNKNGHEEYYKFFIEKWDIYGCALKRKLQYSICKKCFTKTKKMEETLNITCHKGCTVLLRRSRTTPDILTS